MAKVIETELKVFTGVIQELRKRNPHSLELKENLIELYPDQLFIVIRHRTLEIVKADFTHNEFVVVASSKKKDPYYYENYRNYDTYLATKDNITVLLKHVSEFKDVFQKKVLDEEAKSLFK